MPTPLAPAMSLSRLSPTNTHRAGATPSRRHSSSKKNRSGFPVATLARFFKIEPKEILGVHDELDVMPGQAKLTFGGSSGGHNGLQDLHSPLGTLDFWRLRLGLGQPGIKAEVV